MGQVFTAGSLQATLTNDGFEIRKWEEIEKKVLSRAGQDPGPGRPAQLNLIGGEKDNMKKSIWAALVLCLGLAGEALAVSVPDGTVSVQDSYTATETDESAVEVSGTAKVTIEKANIQKTSGEASSADASSFRGVNAAVRVYEQGELTLSDSEITAEAPNATGVFAYEDGVIVLEDCTVTVSGGGAGGVQVAGGGTLTGHNLTVTSASKAAIRSDRGGGTMVLDGGTYRSTGKNGCPAIYSTADITVSNAQCLSEQSRAVIIEGKNTVTLENVTIEGNDQSTKEGSVKANVLLYQSASGDASEGTSVFTMTGGEMTARSGAMFYCTNTSSIINLKQADLNLSDSGELLIVSAGRWGKDGKNGGQCTLNAEQQTLKGTISVDGLSSLAIQMTGSELTGSINSDGEGGDVDIDMDADSKWTLTGDSHIRSFSGKLENVEANGHHLFVDGTQVL